MPQWLLAVTRTKNNRTTVEPLDREKIQAAISHLEAVLRKTDGNGKNTFTTDGRKAKQIKEHLTHAELYCKEMLNAMLTDKIVLKGRSGFVEHLTAKK